MPREQRAEEQGGLLGAGEGSPPGVIHAFIEIPDFARTQPGERARHGGGKAALPLSPAQVVIQMPASDEGEGLPAGEQAFALGEGMPGVAARVPVDVSRFLGGERHAHAAEGVDNGDERGKVNAHPAVRSHAEIAGDDVGERVAAGVRIAAHDGVDLGHPPVFPFDEQIPRHSDRVDPPVPVIQPDEHHGVAPSVCVQRAILVDSVYEIILRAARHGNQKGEDAQDQEAQHHAQEKLFQAPGRFYQTVHPRNSHKYSIAQEKRLFK